MRTPKAPIFLIVDSTMYWINLYPLDYGPVHKLPATFGATFSVASYQPATFFFSFLNSIFHAEQLAHLLLILALSL